MDVNRSYVLSSEKEIDELYGAPALASVKKEIDYLHPVYQAWIKASPFAVLATSGPEGLDASPRGDAQGFVVIVDDRTLLIPDRRGNNRADSLRNVVRDPRVAMLFMIPGINETLRVNGRATVSIAPDLLQRYAVEDKAPRSVLIVHVETVYFQCSRAIVRSGLWDPNIRCDRGQIPTAGQILDALSNSEFEAEPYDKDLPERMATTLY